MDVEQLSGEADVYVKKTGEVIGRFPFTWTKSPRRPGSSLMHIDLKVGLDAANARRLMTGPETLMLRLKDGRCQDFQVKSVSGAGDVIQVNAMDDLRTEA